MIEIGQHGKQAMKDIGAEWKSMTEEELKELMEAGVFDVPAPFRRSPSAGRSHPAPPST
jgi:hypothetical protein